MAVDLNGHRFGSLRVVFVLFPEQNKNRHQHNPP